MSTSKFFDRICCVALVVAILITVAFLNGEALGIEAADRVMGYEDRLFNTDEVHTIDIVIDDWDSFFSTCQSEEYSVCSVVIDGEAYKNVGIRGKGNTSLSTVSSMDSDRYSFKIEFDQYDSTNTYYGLDKLCLNNIIQDNTYMKDFLVYQMMNEFGVDAPLCSYVYITVNGEDWGLYLAVEGVEDSFLQRTQGSDYGELYKPDSMSMGGFGMGSDDVKLQYIDDNAESYSNIFGNAKTDISEEDQERLIDSLKALSEWENMEEVVDINSVIRYFVVHNFVVNGDSYTGSMIHNYYLYEENGQLSMIPWDYNLAFGTFQGNDADSAVNDPIDSPVSGDISDRPMIAWIFESEEYTELYHQYFEEFLAVMFDSGKFAELVDNTAEMIAPYVEKDPTKFCTCEEFETGVETIREFCLLRAESVSGQLEGTISSTSEGQAEGDNALVDASGLTLSDMGTMNHGMNRGTHGEMSPSGEKNQAMQESQSGSFRPQMPEQNMEGTDTSNMPSMPEEMDMSNIPGAPSMEGSFERTENQGNVTGQPVLIVGSLVTLLAGLFIAFRFRR